jgi:hypothetical protein
MLLRGGVAQGAASEIAAFGSDLPNEAGSTPAILRGSLPNDCSRAYMGR